MTNTNREAINAYLRDWGDKNRRKKGVPKKVVFANEEERRAHIKKYGREWRMQKRREQGVPKKLTFASEEERKAHHAKYDREQYQKTKGTLLARGRIRAQLPEVKERRRELDKQWRKDNPKLASLRVYKKHLKRYGLTYEDYMMMLRAQKGRCAAPGCKEYPVTLRHNVDHCHATGVVRALLCRRCNQWLGIYERNRRKWEAYLELYGNGNPLIYGKEPRSGTDSIEEQPDLIPMRSAGAVRGGRNPDPTPRVYEGVRVYATPWMESLQGGQRVAACLPILLR